MKTYTKDSLIQALLAIRQMGWIKNARPGNAGGVGNTLEDLLEIEENNLPIPNAAEWELKTTRAKGSSLTTGFHIEPSPTAYKFVPRILLPLYGWPHEKAGIKYPADEMSFRQTINACGRTDRGFGININYSERKIEVSFDYRAVASKHSDWLKTVETRVGLTELSPQPYWGFNDLFHVLGIKLKNCFYIKAQTKKIEGVEYFWYKEIYMLSGFDQDRFIMALENCKLLVDFDARTGHNHGTKFRARKDILPELYTSSISL